MPPDLSTTITCLCRDVAHFQTGYQCQQRSIWPVWPTVSLRALIYLLISKALIKRVLICAVIDTRQQQEAPVPAT